MHHANHFYGHAHIMARYAGLAEVPRIWGYLQHGWNIVDGFAVGTPFPPGFPKFVWSDVVRRRGWSMGRRDYVTVGAPFGYLLELEGQRAWAASAPEREGTLVYPFHGWEGQEVVGSHDDLIQEIRATEDGPVTICLYINEYKMPEVRQRYETTGFRVICHGNRGYLWKGTDPRFLYKQLAELRRHRKVVSNRMSSAIFYGAATGCDVGVYGDPMLLEAEDPVFGGHNRLQRLFPALHERHVPNAEAHPYAVRELGLDVLLSPEEVVEVFGWQHARRRTARDQVVLPSEGELAYGSEDLSADADAEQEDGDAVAAAPEPGAAP